MRTVAASASLTMSFLFLTSYPSGTTPPTHMPFFFEAAILSRMRSPVTSRSNWGEGQQHIEGQSPHAGRRIERLGHRNEGDAIFVEQLDQLGEVGERSGEAIDL